MDADIPKRQFTKEEINRCYLRWQQLRNENGKNAPKVPEFIYLTKVLHAAAKQQQMKNNNSGQTMPNYNANSSSSMGTPQMLDQSQGMSPNLSALNNKSLSDSTFTADSTANISSPNFVNRQTSASFIQGNGRANSNINSPQGMSRLPATQQVMDGVQNFNTVSQPNSRQPSGPMPNGSAAGTPGLNLNSAGNPKVKSPSAGPSIFTPEQSELLKSQIAILKCFVNHQVIPMEFQNAIQKSINNPPNFRRMLLSLSEFVKRKNLSASTGTNAFSPNAMPSNIGNPNTIQSAAEAGQASKAIGTQRQISNPMQNSIPISTPVDYQENGLKATTASPSELQNQYLQNMKMNNKLSESQSPPPQDLPTMNCPIPLSKFQKENPNIENVANINDPDLMVDSFSLPDFYTKAVTYDDLFSMNNEPLVIEPSVLPTGIDVHSAMDIYQTFVALNIDISVDECLNSIIDENTDENAREEAYYDYYALQLLPLQKAMRGHLLHFEWYQNALLINTHPNFLSKIRNINMQDAMLTQTSYQQQLSSDIKRQEHERKNMLKYLLENSVAAYNNKLDRHSRVIKFGHKLVGLHVTLEKEEQKRSERKAKERLQALKANDEEAYIKLLDQTKDTRITHLLKQTNTFLESLTKAVKDQQSYTKNLVESHIKDPNDEHDDIHMSNELEEGEQESIDYYHVAHKVKEEIRTQPSMLVGGTLKEYQIKGLQWMVSLFNNHLNGILADEMGLGKTIQTISLLTYLYETKNVRGPFLVIVPLSTLPNWSNEFDKWAPTMRVISYKGPPNERKMKQGILRSGEFDVVITTFEYIIKEKALLSKVKWVHMIIDEGHRMKNAQSKLSLTLNTFYHSDYRLILTGTPLQNNLPELWALLNFVLPKIFNSVKSFDEWFNTPFANTGGQDKIELSEEETLLIIRRLHKVLRPFLLRRLKKDVESELPDKVEKVIKCKMSALQAAIYQQMLKHRQLFTGEQTNKKNVGLRGFNNQIMQLKKICNHPFVFEEVEDQINPARATNHSIWRVAGKFELLERVLLKLKATGHRVLIFFQMTQIMDIMEDFLRLIDIKYLRLDGHTKSDERGVLLSLFNEPDSEYFCFILSTRAGGLGLNLQTADTVIIFDTDWNPHQDLQAQDRAHRIGQKNEVKILRLITTNSVEEAILERAHKKLDIDGKVIQAGKFDNKSTAEEQEALLRSLLEQEDDRKRKREAGIEEDEELKDSELNEILARSDSEMEVFRRLDEERVKSDEALGIMSRLMESHELPEIYHKDIGEELEREETESAAIYSGRGARERKAMIYDDNMSEEQWLRQFEESDEENSKPKKLVVQTPNDTPEIPSVPTVVEELQDPMEVPTDGLDSKKENSTPVPDIAFGVDEDKSDTQTETTQEKRKLSQSINSSESEPKRHKPVEQQSAETVEDKPKEETETAAITPTPKVSNKIRSNKNSRSKSSRNRNSQKAKKLYGLDYSRSPDLNNVSMELREDVANKAQTLFDYLMDYEDETGRPLADIFLEKPPKDYYPDYYLVIRYPLAFDTVEKNIEKKLYLDLKEVVEDFHLIFSNAQVYNTEGSLVFNDAQSLEQATLEKYKEITGDTDPIDFHDFDTKYITKPLPGPASTQTS